jgi:hypothetical protein
VSRQQRRRQRTQAQFAKQNPEWETWKIAEQAKLHKYLSVHAATHNLESLSCDAFIELVAAEDTQVLATTFAGAVKFDLAAAPPIYFWLVDDSMVFVIPSAKRLMEHGFFTQDSHFIEGVCDIARKYTPLTALVGDA